MRPLLGRCLVQFFRRKPKRYEAGRMNLFIHVRKTTGWRYWW